MTTAPECHFSLFVPDGPIRPYKIIVLDDEAVIGKVVRDELQESGDRPNYILLITVVYDWTLENQPDLIIAGI